MTYCIKCGKRVEIVDEHCSNCGNKIVKEDVDGEIEGLRVKTENIEKESKGNVKEIIGYIFILIFLIAIIFLVLTKDNGISLSYLAKAKTWLLTKI